MLNSFNEDAMGVQYILNPKKYQWKYSLIIFSTKSLLTNFRTFIQTPYYNTKTLMLKMKTNFWFLIFEYIFFIISVNENMYYKLEVLVRFWQLSQHNSCLLIVVGSDFSWQFRLISVVVGESTVPSDNSSFNQLICQHIFN